MMEKRAEKSKDSITIRFVKPNFSCFTIDRMGATFSCSRVENRINKNEHMATIISNCCVSGDEAFSPMAFNDVGCTNGKVKER